MERVRRTYKDVSNYVESFGHILLSQEKDVVDKNGYVKAKTKLYIECEKGHKFKTSFYVYRNGKFKCKKCVQENGYYARKYTFEDIVELFKKENYEVISSKDCYKNMETVLNLKCHRGHLWSSSYNNFKSGYRCKYCKIEDKENNEFQNDKQVLIDNGYKVLSFERAKNNFFTESIFTVECKNGHITTKSIRSIRSKKLSCVECMGNKKKTLEDVVKIFKSYGYEVISHDGYENNQSRFLISCKNGHKFDTTYASFQQRDKRCCLCDEGVTGVSKGEKKISLFLDENNIDYIYQYKTEECKLKMPLPFDFHLPKHNIIIEYDGEQHYKAFDYFGGIDKFISQKISDTIKTQYCKNNNIKLIRIPYWEFDNIEKILNLKI